MQDMLILFFFLFAYQMRKVSEKNDIPRKIVALSTLPIVTTFLKEKNFPLYGDFKPELYVYILELIKRK